MNQDEMPQGGMPQGGMPREGMPWGGPETPSPDIYRPDDYVKRVLWTRIDFITPEELRILDAMITLENLPLMLKLFPECAELLAEATAFDSAAGRGRDDAPAGIMPTAQPPGTQAHPGMAQRPKLPQPSGLAAQRFRITG